MPYNFCNHNIFIPLKIKVIFKMDKVIIPTVYFLIYFFNYYLRLMKVII